jgi:SNF2 family DNA or RNA helicase
LFPFPWLLCRRKSIGLSSVRVHCGLTLSYTDCRFVGQNLDILRSLTQAATTKAGKPLVSKAVGKANLNNMLMQLRKSVHRCLAVSTWYSSLRRCLQHPYLNSEDIEPRNLTPAEAHERLIGASTKLRFLKMLLPKLKAKGHRILLFSQVSGALSSSLS